MWRSRIESFKKRYSGPYFRFKRLGPSKKLSRRQTTLPTVWPEECGRIKARKFLASPVKFDREFYGRILIINSIPHLLSAVIKNPEWAARAGCTVFTLMWS